MTPPSDAPATQPLLPAPGEDLAALGAAPLNERKGDDFARRIALAVAIAIGLIGLVALVVYAADVLIVVFAGVLVAVVLRGTSSWLAARSRLSQGWALAAVVFVLLMAAVAIGTLLTPRIAGQFQQLSQQLPKSIDKVKAWANGHAAGRAVLHATSQPASSGQGDSLPGGDLLRRATSWATGTLSVLVDVVLILFLGLYFAVEPELYVGGALHLVPRRHRAHAREIFNTVGRTLRWWLVGQGIDMAAVGVLTAVGLKLLGIPLAMTLGLLAALMNFIPNFGALLSFAITGLLALTISPAKLLWTFLLFLGVQSFEGYALQPFIQRRTVSLPPALTILAQALLGLLFGAPGLILATPLMAVAMVLVKILYVRDVLDDCVPVPEGRNGEPAAK